MDATLFALEHPGTMAPQTPQATSMDQMLEAGREAAAQAYDNLQSGCTDHEMSREAFDHDVENSGLI